MYVCSNFIIAMATKRMVSLPGSTGGIVGDMIRFDLTIAPLVRNLTLQIFLVLALLSKYTGWGFDHPPCPIGEDLILTKSNPHLFLTLAREGGEVGIILIGT